jgi:NAD-reducing hydrogenase small subunit
MRKIKVATIWLDGCSGCHMSLLDLDTALIPMARKIELVYGPLVDVHEFPEDVDVTFIEGAVSTDEDVERVQQIRQHSKLVVSLGDCAVTGNVAAMRNTVPVKKLLHSVYVEKSDRDPAIPRENLPQLAPQCRPVQDFVKIDISVPGCPPSSKVIGEVLESVLDNRKPEAAMKLKFG